MIAPRTTGIIFCLRAAWAVRAEKKERSEMRRVAFWGTMIIALMAGSLSATEWFVDCTRPDDSGNTRQEVFHAKDGLKAFVRFIDRHRTHLFNDVIYI